VKKMLAVETIAPPHTDLYSARLAFIDAYTPTRKGPSPGDPSLALFTSDDAALISAATDFATRSGFPVDKRMVRLVPAHSRPRTQPGAEEPHLPSRRCSS
jgi:hypothetical protein